MWFNENMQILKFAESQLAIIIQLFPLRASCTSLKEKFILVFSVCIVVTFGRFGTHSELNLAHEMNFRVIQLGTKSYSLKNELLFTSEGNF